MTGRYPDHGSSFGFFLHLIDIDLPPSFKDHIETTLNLMGMFFHFLSGLQTIQPYKNVLGVFQMS